MTIDQAIVRAADCAEEEQQPFYIYTFGPQAFVSPFASFPDKTWDVTVKPDRRLTFQKS